MVRIVILRSKCPAGIEPRVDKEASSLARAGYDVRVLLWDREGKHPKRERLHGYDIIRFRRRAPYGKPMLLFHMLGWWCHVLKFLRQEKCDIIHACDLDTGLPALFAARLRRCRLVYDIFDFYAYMIAVSLHPSLRSMIAGFERRVAAGSDLLVIADDARLEQLGNAGRQVRKRITIMNVPEEKVPLSQKSAEKFTLFYGGIINRERGLHELVKAVEALESCELVVAGYGPDEKELIPIFKKSRNVRYLGNLPYAEVLGWTAKANVVPALYDPAVPNNRYASPNKLFEAMMFSKPVIVNRETTMAGIVKKENCGMVVKYGDVRELRDAILKLKSGVKLSIELGMNGRMAYEREYNWKEMENRLLLAYEELTESIE